MAHALQGFALFTSLRMGITVPMASPHHCPSLHKGPVSQGLAPHRNLKG